MMRITATTTEGVIISKTLLGQADKKFAKSDGKEIMIGDTIKAAITDAKKKFAAELGLNQNVYSGEC